jgi:phage/conjugal plasmid C-4 type zinc finger TraR family protein
MGDIVDRAQAREAEILADALARARPPAVPGSGLADCEDCSAKIPVARRRAVPGCTRCVHCQVEFEKRKRLQERT